MKKNKREEQYKDYLSADFFDKDNSQEGITPIFGILAPNGIYYPCHFSGHATLINAIKYWHPEFNKNELILFKRSPIEDGATIAKVIVDETSKGIPNKKQKEWIKRNWSVLEPAQRDSIEF